MVNYLKQENQPYKNISESTGVVPMNRAKLRNAGKVSEVASELKKLAKD